MFCDKMELGRKTGASDKVVQKDVAARISTFISGRSFVCE